MDFWLAHSSQKRQKMPDSPTKLSTKPHPHGHFMILFYPFLFRPFPSLHHGQHSGKVLLTISADQIHSPAAFPP
jgi:hypothetical protein